MNSMDIIIFFEKASKLAQLINDPTSAAKINSIKQGYKIKIFQLKKRSNSTDVKMRSDTWSNISIGWQN